MKGKIVDSELQEELKRKRTALHHAEMRLAGKGISADPYEIMIRDDLLAEVRSLQAQLGQSQTPTPQEIRWEYRAPRYEAPEPAPQFQERMVGQQERMRQHDIEHQMGLLKIHRGNMAHYRAQARAHGGVDLAPPVTRNGMAEQRDAIARIKRALSQLGQAVDDLPGDE